MLRYMPRNLKGDLMRQCEVQLEICRVRVLPDGRMTRASAAAYLGLKPKTLTMWAMQRKGPRSLRLGGRCFYFKADLDAFVDAAARYAKGELGSKAAKS